MREFGQIAEQAHIFYPDPQEQYLRQQGMRDFVGDYLQGLEDKTIDPGLRPYQKIGFPLVLSTIQDSLSEPVNLESPAVLDQLSHVQIAEAAMAYGKSFMLAKIAVATGIGELPYEGSERPLRALYLSYTKRGVEEIAKACRKFAPTLSLYVASQERQNLEGYDISVLSYAALCRMVKKRLAGLPTPLDGQHFDLIGSDENHRRWAPRFGHAVNIMARGRVEVGMTGTRRITEENKDFTVSFRCSMRNMIDSGYAPSTQLLAFPTGKSLTAGIRTPRDPFDALEKPYTWQELQSLALDAERNYQIVKLLTMFAEHGHFILGSMIPGARCAHAKIIQPLVNDERITDPITGKKRKLNFVPIDGYMPDDEINDLLERSKHPFRISGLDGLLNTSLLNESFDNPNFTAVVAACPMPHIQLAQLAGRLNRGSSDDVVVFAQLVDHTPDHTRRPAFVSEIYDEGSFFNGMVIGQAEKVRLYNLNSGWNTVDKNVSKGERSSNGRLSPTIIVTSALHAILKQKADALDAYLDEGRNEPVYDETLEAREALTEPPPDSIRATELHQIPNIRAANLSEYAFYTLLRQNGFTYSLVKGGRGGFANYVHNKSEVIAFLENHKFAEERETTRYTHRDLARLLSTSLNTLGTEIANLRARGENMDTELRRVRGAKESNTFDERQKCLLEQALEAREQSEVPETEGSPYPTLRALSSEVGIPPDNVRNFIKQALNSNLPRFVSPEVQKMMSYVEPSDAAEVRRHFSYPEVPEKAVMLTLIGQEFNVDEQAVVAAFDAVGRKGAVQQGRRTVKGKDGALYGKGFQLLYPFFSTDEQAVTVVKEHLRKHVIDVNVPQDPPKNAQEALNALGAACDPTLLNLVIERTGRYIDSHKEHWFLNSADIKAVAAKIQSFPLATSAVMTLNELITQCQLLGIDGISDMREEDILNLYQANIRGCRPLTPRGRLAPFRTLPMPDKPSVLKIHFKRTFLDEVEERLLLFQRTRRFPALRELRKQRSS